MASNYSFVYLIHFSIEIFHNNFFDIFIKEILSSPNIF
jgi:hypothetical protein